MIRETVTPLMLAALVVLAGCGGAISPMDSTTDPGDTAANTGTVNFYISDERNAINDFEHLNVTITAVGFGTADADDEMDDENETDDAEANETETEDDDTDSDDNETTTTEVNETTTTSETTETEDDDADSEETETPTENDDEDDAEADEEDDANESDDGGEVADKNASDDWVVRQVDNVTVDLTQYQGANATLLDQFEIPNGTYTKTFVYISEINGTLTNGEQVNVKLPSQKLHINSEFTVGNGEEIDFVFDITVFKAGNSGKYILKPVVSQSGTDVPIEADDDEDDADENDDAEGPPDEADDQNEDDAADLNASFLGNVTPGENVTVSVTQNGSAVEGAQVFVDDRRVGQTDANGTIAVSVPDDADEFEVTVRYEDGEAELSVEFEDDAEASTTTTSAA